MDLQPNPQAWPAVSVGGPRREPKPVLETCTLQLSLDKLSDRTMLYERSSEKEVTPVHGGNLFHSTSSRCSSLDDCTRGFRKNFSFQRVEDFKNKHVLLRRFHTNQLREIPQN